MVSPTPTRNKGCDYFLGSSSFDGGWWSIRSVLGTVAAEIRQRQNSSVVVVVGR